MNVEENNCGYNKNAVHFYMEFVVGMQTNMTLT